MARSDLAKVLGNSERVNEAHYDDLDAEDARASSATVASKLGKLVADLGLDLNKPWKRPRTAWWANLWSNRSPNRKTLIA